MVNAQVHVYYRLVERLAPGEDNEAWRILDGQERGRASRFVFEPDRVRYVAAHALLRHALSAVAAAPADAWRFEAPPNHKPRIAGPLTDGLAFSLTHTPGLVACAIGRVAQLGIDAESLDARVDALELATQHFSAPEVCALRACPPEERQRRFIELWTLKEAYVKAIGLGLAHPLDRFGFSVDDKTTTFHSPPGVSEATWSFHRIVPSPAHHLAVAVHDPASDSYDFVVQGAL